MEETRRITVTGVVVAGGASRRMGRDKALLPWRGRPLISYPLEVLRRHFPEVIIAGGSGEELRSLGAPVHPDLLPARGALVGLHSGLSAAASPRAFFAACDMPFILDDVVRLVLAAAGDAWAVVPLSSGGPEPLLALYAKECLPAMERLIGKGEMRISALFREIPVRFIPAGEVQAVDPGFRSFVNLNNPGELSLLDEPPAAGGVHG